MSNQIKGGKATICCLQEIHFKLKKNKVKVKEQEKYRNIYHDKDKH